MKYEITTGTYESTWSNHRTETGALKGYIEAVNDGQNDIKIYKRGNRVFPFNTYNNDIGYKGYLISEDETK